MEIINRLTIDDLDCTVWVDQGHYRVTIDEYGMAVEPSQCCSASQRIAIQLLREDLADRETWT